MKLFTPLSPIPPLSAPIHHRSQLLTMGSCFAEVVGSKLEENKFQVLNNPLGIAFNPLSLFELLKMGLGLKKWSIRKHTYLGHSFSFDLHSKWTAPEAGKLEQMLTAQQQLFTEKAPVLSHLILTFGTAHVYRKKDDQQLVNNCHKYPGSYFYREMLSPDQIEKSFTEMYQQLRQLNPGISLILTVSPVRHVRDSLRVNSLSKSILRYSCQLIQDKHPEVVYFPSYELMMDELRDYRFYKEDMIHPSAQAENIIWERFVKSSLTPEAKKLLKGWGQLQRELDHLPQQPWSENYLSFLQSLAQKLTDIQKEGIEVEKEQKEVTASIARWKKNYGTMQKK